MQKITTNGQAPTTWLIATDRLEKKRMVTPEMQGPTTNRKKCNQNTMTG
jgi:hypothetical protein